MMGRDERERAVHCANRERERREGQTGPVPLLCVCSLFILWGVYNGFSCFDLIHIFVNVGGEGNN